MSALAKQAEEYLQLRRALGHDLADAARLLPGFVAYMDSLGAKTITVDIALRWVQQPDADPGSSVWLRRMAAVRGFARHMSGIEPTTQVPPFGLVTFRPQRRPPFIYSADDVETLIAAVPRLVVTPLRVATLQTMIGLLATTGMRVGEAVRLDCSDIDWTEGVVAVRASKFKKSRELPLDPTVVDALASYAVVRDRLVPEPKASAFFLSKMGTPVAYSHFGDTFRKLVFVSGVGADSPVRPRIHDLRHSFATHTLVRWYQRGEDVGALLPRLSTYMGHVEPGYTYWYLSAVPELLALAADRLETAAGAQS
jgi:integrase/recombinase XerD